MSSPLAANDDQVIESYGRLLRKALLAWTLVGLIMFAQDIARTLYWNGPHPFREGLYWLVRCSISALLTPYIIWGARLWAIEKKHWRRRVSLHLLFSIAFGLIRAAMESTLILPLHAKEVMGPRPPWAETGLGVFTVLTLYTTLSGVVAYWVIISIEATRRYYEKFRERAREAMRLELHSSELRAQVVQAQLSALKMQLQPHFLFNTLNAIVVLVRQHKGKQEEEALTRFSDLLRAVLVDINAQEVPLYRELEYVQLYLSIEQMRFPDRLKIQVAVDPSILDAAVPHMGLQPLVENAVRHGIAPRVQGGTITVEASLAGENLRLAIIDNGAGLAESQATAGHGLGLKNLRSRLEQLYSGRAQLVVMDDREGTSATLLLPYRAHPDAEVQAPLIGRFTDEARFRERVDCR
jgi:signal transduction histidine kinase